MSNPDFSKMLAKIGFREENGNIYLEKPYHNPIIKVNVGKLLLKFKKCQPNLNKRWHFYDYLKKMPTLGTYTNLLKGIER